MLPELLLSSVRFSAVCFALWGLLLFIHDKNRTKGVFRRYHIPRLLLGTSFIVGFSLPILNKTMSFLGVAPQYGPIQQWLAPIAILLAMMALAFSISITTGKHRTTLFVFVSLLVVSFGAAIEGII